MPETPVLPLTPVDSRFWARVDRARAFRPAPPPPAQEWRSPAVGVAAAEALRDYTRRRPLSHLLARAAVRHRSVAERLPVAAFWPVCVLAAAGLLPVGLLVLLVCRPDLRGRPFRRRLLSPADVGRALVMRWTPHGVAGHLLRAFAGRAKWEGSWFA